MSKAIVCLIISPDGDWTITAADPSDELKVYIVDEGAADRYRVREHLKRAPIELLTEIVTPRNRPTLQLLQGGRAS